jgi:hypothetical protein
MTEVISDENGENQKEDKFDNLLYLSYYTWYYNDLPAVMDVFRIV